MDDTSKKAQGTLFCSCFSGFRTRHKNSLLLNIILKETLFYISIFKNGPKYAPMVVRFIFNFPCASFQVVGYEALKIQSQISIKAF